MSSCASRTLLRAQSRYGTCACENNDDDDDDEERQRIKRGGGGGGKAGVSGNPVTQLAPLSKNRRCRRSLYLWQQWRLEKLCSAFKNTRGARHPSPLFFLLNFLKIFYSPTRFWKWKYCAQF